MVAPLPEAEDSPPVIAAPRARRPVIDPPKATAVPPEGESTADGDERATDTTPAPEPGSRDGSPAAGGETPGTEPATPARPSGASASSDAEDLRQIEFELADIPEIEATGEIDEVRED